VPYADFGDPQSLNLYAYVRNLPTSRYDVAGHYEVNASRCSGSKQASCQKKYDKTVAGFEKQRQKALLSKDPNVRAAAAAFGKQGEKNGVHVGFRKLGPNIKGRVDTAVSVDLHSIHNGKGKPIDVEVTFNSNLKGTSLRETIAHEGTHVADDLKFLTSYDFATGHYNSNLNLTHLQTEINAYTAGAGVTQEHGFGPHDGPKIVNFVFDHYPNAMDAVFPTEHPNFPQLPGPPEEQ
jgi:hypothetical protein